jgi:hypothetical protein
VTADEGKSYVPIGESPPKVDVPKDARESLSRRISGNIGGVESTLERDAEVIAGDGGAGKSIGSGLSVTSEATEDLFASAGLSKGELEVRSF